MGDLVCRNVLANPDFVGYTAGRPIGISSTRLNWRRRGANPLRQAQNTPRSADYRASESPPERFGGPLSQPDQRTLRPSQRFLC